MVKPQDQRSGRGAVVAEIDEQTFYQFAADYGSDVRDHLMSGGEVILVNPKDNKIRY
jgi:hypothetical protein